MRTIHFLRKFLILLLLGVFSCKENPVSDKDTQVVGFSVKSGLLSDKEQLVVGTQSSLLIWINKDTLFNGDIGPSTKFIEIPPKVSISDTSTVFFTCKKQGFQTFSFSLSYRNICEQDNKTISFVFSNLNKYDFYLKTGHLTGNNISLTSSKVTVEIEGETVFLKQADPEIILVKIPELSLNDSDQVKITVEKPGFYPIIYNLLLKDIPLLSNRTIELVFSEVRPTNFYFMASRESVSGLLVGETVGLMVKHGDELLFSGRVGPQRQLIQLPESLPDSVIISITATPDIGEPLFAKHSIRDIIGLPDQTLKFLFPILTRSQFFLEIKTFTPDSMHYSDYIGSFMVKEKYSDRLIYQANYPGYRAIIETSGWNVSDTTILEIVIEKVGFNTTRQPFLLKKVFSLNYRSLSIFISKIFSYDNLVLYLDFNNSIEDKSFFKQKTTNSNLMKYRESGISGSAGILSGNYITVYNSPDLNPSSFTISAWVYFESNFMGIGNEPIVDKPASSHSSPYYQYHLGVTSSSGSGAYNTFGFSVGSVDYKAIGTVRDIWMPKRWYHVVGVFDGSDQMGTISLYVDGVFQISMPTYMAISDLGSNIYIGKFGNLNSYLYGAIDELRIYNRVLSQSEVKALYAETKFPSRAIVSGNPKQGLKNQDVR